MILSLLFFHLMQPDLGALQQMVQVSFVCGRKEGKGRKRVIQ